MTTAQFDYQGKYTTLSLSELREKNPYSISNLIPPHPEDRSFNHRRFSIDKHHYFFKLKDERCTQGAFLFRRSDSTLVHRVFQLIADLDLYDLTQLLILIMNENKLVVRRNLPGALHKYNIYIGSVFFAVVYDEVPFRELKSATIDLLRYFIQSFISNANPHQNGNHKSVE